MHNKPTKFLLMEQIGNPNRPPRPSNYLVLAIICTVTCCMPLGIVSIIHSTKVDSAYNAGDFALAEESSKKAKNWGIAGLIIGTVFYIGFFIIYGFALMASAANGY